MVINFINSNELLKNSILVINSKRLSNVIKVGYNLDIMRQSAFIVLNPNPFNSYGFLFNCTTLGQASDSMMALT